MTTAEIESYADVSGLAGPDIDTRIILRREVVPMFLADVGNTAWSRKSATITLVAGTKTYDLATDVKRVLSMRNTDDLTVPIKYVGEDDERYASVVATTETGTPEEYILSLKAAVTTSTWQASFGPIPDAAGTMRYVYEWTIAWSDLTTSVDLAPYIPTHYQWGLVCGLQRRILFHRVGISDQRYVQADQDYQAWVARAIENREGARRNLGVYVR